MPLDEIPQLDEVDEKLDDLDTPTSLEVYEAMLPYNNDMVAAAGIQRALAGGSGGGYTPGGTDVAVADGGTGASTAADARTNLGLVIGTNVGAPPVPNGRLKLSGTNYLQIPGMVVSGPTTFTASANRAHYYPFITQTSIVIDQIVFELVTGVAASTVRFAIYNADINWQPTSLVTNTDTGDIASAAANQGVIPTTITDTTLAPGRYLFWENASSGNPVYRAVLADASAFLGMSPVLGAGGTPQITQVFEAQAYGAPPSTGLAYTGITINIGAFIHPAFVRVKTP